MTSDPRLTRLEGYINSDQESVCQSGARYIILEGVAGSRKTDTLVRLGIRRHLREKKNVLFLTQVGSVTDEICSRVGQWLGAPVYRQAGSNHYLALSCGRTVEVANFDAWVHRQLQDQGWNLLQSMGSYHAFKSRSLAGLDNFRGFCLKNGEHADEVLVDECQDFDPVKAQLIVSLLQKAPHVRAAFCGDYMQTIFEQSLDGTHPLTIFAGLPSCERFYMQKCYRCPAGHVAFCNRLLRPALETHKCRPIVATNHDDANKPFLFTHGGTSRRYDVVLLVAQLCQMTGVLLDHDPTLRPQDFCFMMRKSNQQPVFDKLRVRLEEMWAARGCPNAVVHFATQHDGYRNPIQWEHAAGKSCLISIHGDKGKGHKVVFFIGLTQKSIPDECAMHKDKELLFHSLLNVALTRSTKYLMVGFHHAQPSVYLTRAVPLEGHAHVSWARNDNTLADRLAACSRFPAPNLIHDVGRAQPLHVPTLRMLSVVEISRRYERPEDLFGFNPRVEVVKFGRRVRIQAPDDAYPVLAGMCELVLMRELRPDDFLRDLEWFPQQVLFTDDERLLSWSHDFRLAKWVNTDMYAQQVDLMRGTYATVLENDAALRGLVDQLRQRPSHVLRTWFGTQRFRQCVEAFRSGQPTAQDWWLLALLFYELQNRGSYHGAGVVLYQPQFQALYKNIRSFISLLTGNVVFRPCHDVLASVSDPEALADLGFERALDDHYFENGYHYGILGTSGVMDGRALYDVKVSPVDFAMEWFMQTSFHANLPVKKATKPPERLAVVNLLTGRMHAWENRFQNPKALLRRVMRHYSFPDELADNLCRTNHHRFRRPTT